MTRVSESAAWPVWDSSGQWSHDEPRLIVRQAVSDPITASFEKTVAGYGMIWLA